MSWENNYETEAQRVKRRLKETLTGREKLANWWEYHKIHVAVVVVLLLFVLYFAMQDRSILDADYTVAWVSGQMLDDETAEDISAKLAQYGQDLDGNRAVRVNIHQIKLDLRLVIERCGTEGQQKYGELLALNSDLEVGQSGIFLTDDPASLQAYTGAFLYRNGTMPENGPPGLAKYGNLLGTGGCRNGLRRTPGLLDWAAGCLGLDKKPYTPDRCPKEEASFFDRYPSEYPASNVGDFRECCLSLRCVLGTVDCLPEFHSCEILPGKPALEGLPDTFGRAEDCNTLRIRLEDEIAGILVELDYTAFTNLNVITRSVRIRNQGADAVHLNRCLSACLHLPYEGQQMMTLHGSWARERGI